MAASAETTSFTAIGDTLMNCKRVRDLSLVGSTWAGRVLGTAIVAIAAAAHGAPALTTLASFDGFNHGESPLAELFVGLDGNLYGTTQKGGAFGPSDNSYGTAFLVDVNSNSLKTIASFDGSGGIHPRSGLVADAAGNLYGTTERGGEFGAGAVFRLDPVTNVFTTLASFGGDDGAFPYAGLLADAAGNLYGTTFAGGPGGRGTIFRLNATTKTLTTLASFDGANGSGPRGDLIADDAGNLYGATAGGGAFGRGTVFRLDAATYAITTLVSFDGNNGANPAAGLVADAAGNLYGTTFGARDISAHRGTLFQLNVASGTLTTLASFNGDNGGGPEGDLIADAVGNLFGTTIAGGAFGRGTVFRLDAATNTLVTLASLNFANGVRPRAGLVADAFGDLYGTTEQGGIHGRGAVFRISNAGFVVPEPSTGRAIVATIGSLIFRMTWRRRTLQGPQLRGGDPSGWTPRTISSRRSTT
ncbi:MAG: hypothetical protein IT424_08370 [Pirellulales bacterium]|nr:hypothetical protein [Pirellulales bacterium]